jgi:hypothetical protein
MKTWKPLPPPKEHFHLENHSCSVVGFFYFELVRVYGVISEIRPRSLRLEFFTVHPSIARYSYIAPSY